MSPDEHRYRRAELALWESFGASPRERMLELPALDTRIRVQELGSGPAIVFVHGASNAGTSWASLATRLGGNQCILLDRPGCGLSAPLGRGHDDMEALDEYADALLADVLDALDLERAHVVATSFGGYFALRAASRRPARIDRLVLLGWTFGAPTTAVPLPMRIAMQPALGRLAVRLPPNERMVRSLLRQIGLRRAVDTGRFGPPEVAWFVSLLRDTDTMRNEIDATPRVVTLRGFNEQTLLDPSVLARVTAPTLVLWGDEDPMGDAAIAQSFVEHLPNAELELLHEVGHAPWIDEPDRVAKRIAAFLGA